MKNPKDLTIHVDDLNIRYWDVGSADSVILLIHGMGACVEYWENNIVALSEHHRVIALDLVGFGRSDKPDISYDAVHFTQFLRSFLHQLNIAQISLVGHSLGGAIAIHFAATFPEQVKQLVLVSSVGFDREIPLAFRLLTLPWASKIFSYANPKRVGHFLKKFTYYKESIRPAFIETIYQMITQPGAKKIFVTIVKNHVNFLGIRQDVLELIQSTFAQLTLPILILWGKQDRLLRPRGADKAQQLIPPAKLVWLDQCGHLPQMEYPDKFNQQVLRFLNG